MSRSTPPQLVVADTDAISFVFNRDPVRRGRYRRHLREGHTVLPFAVVGELLYGAEARGWGATRRGQLEDFIRGYTVQYPNYAVCALWAGVRAAARAAGRPIDLQDAWVAATALYLEVPLVTHNARHYAGVPLLEVITEPDTSD